MSYTIPNTFATQSGNVPASQLDSNFTTLNSAVNNAFLVGTLAARPLPDGVGNGRYYYATDKAILYRDNGTSWVQVAAPGALTTQQVLTDIATVNWDVSLGGVGTWTIGGNRALAAPTNIGAGGYYTLLVTQDGTGGRTITWNAVYHGTAGTVAPPQPQGAANAVTAYPFISPDGTNLYLQFPGDGAYRSVQVFTGNGTWTKPVGCHRVKVRVVGGGGAGGGAPATAGNFGVGSGGGSGGYTEKTLAVDLIATSNITIGAAGAANSGTTGGSGGASSWADGTNTVSAGGGAGGSSAGAGTTIFAVGGGSGGTGGAGGDVTINGSYGTIGLQIGASSALGGVGGASPLGGNGGSPSASNSSGVSAQVNTGSGGGGANNDGGQGAKSGGAGGSGIIIVEQYF